MIKTSGLTAAAVLVVAIVGGAAGGAVVMGGSDSPAPPAQVRDVDVVSAEQDQVVDPAPTVEPSATAAPQPTMDPEPAPRAEEDDVAGSTETAQKAADRSEAAAKRAEEAKAAAEKAADKASSPSPVTSPATSKAAEPKTCDGVAEGTKLGIPFKTNGMGSGWTGGSAGEKVCRDGKWVVTKEPVDATPPPKPAGDPEPSSPPQ